LLGIQVPIIGKCCPHSKVWRVERNQSEHIRRRHRGNLPVRKCRRLAGSDLPCPLKCMPFGGTIIVGQNRHSGRHNFVQIGFNRGPLRCSRQAIAAEPARMPNYGRICLPGSFKVARSPAAA
jgi:hypothetical protein